MSSDPSIEETLSYDDILLVPSYSDVTPNDITSTTRLAGDLTLNIPILSAAMDTVTEEKMAIAVALEGGAGVIHRNLTPEMQADQVGNVKRYLNWIIDNPVTVRSNQTISDVRSLTEKYKISGLPVIDENNSLCGIITGRDMRFCRDETLQVKDVMTPDPIVERGNPSIESAQEKFDKHKIEKLPVVDDKNKLTGLITVKDMEKHQQFPYAAVDAKGRLLVGAAVSPVDYHTRILLLIRNKVDFIVIDTAHGDSASVIEALKTIKKEYSLPIIAGNVASREGARHIIEAGADAIKVGVGPGSICTTRVVAGIGVAQFSAVIQCAEEAGKSNIPVIADGGVKYSGDLTKAIAAGANTVMIGNLFAGLKEAPGKEILYEGRMFKEYRGMGSIGAIKQGGGERYQLSGDTDPVPEGIEGMVPYRGELRPFLHQLVTGLKKGMVYCGCSSIEQLRNYKKFVKISSAGLAESHVHDVAITQEAPNYSRK